MAKLDARTRTLLLRRATAASAAPQLPEVLRGTLLRRYVRCGKPGCRCRTGRGHGPFLYLTVTLGRGRTRQITIVGHDFPTAKRYVDNYHRLWRLLEKISSINRELLQKRQLPPDGRPRRPRGPRGK